MFLGAIFSKLGAVIRNVKVGLFIFCGRLGGNTWPFYLGWRWHRKQRAAYGSHPVVIGIGIVMAVKINMILKI